MLYKNDQLQNSEGGSYSQSIVAGKIQAIRETTISKRSISVDKSYLANIFLLKIPRELIFVYTSTRVKSDALFMMTVYRIGKTFTQTEKSA